MQRLTFAGPINTFTGYGLHSCQIIRDLQRITGAYVSVRALSRSEMFGAKIPHDILQRFVQQVQPEPWELLLHPPNFMPTVGKRTAYFTMWEATKLPPRGVELLNRAELVIVPCDWNMNCFSAAGVTAPMRKVQLGINTDLFRYRAVMPSEKPICVFGAAGRLAHGGVRKGVNQVIDLFYRAFPEERDVELHIKAFPDCDIKKVRDPRVKVTAAYLSEEAMSNWYTNLSAFVSCARAEGWGLMQHQAMATGVPLISSYFGGVTEFFKPELGYVVPHKLVPGEGAYSLCGHWAEPDEEAIIEAMRTVYNDRWGAWEKGSKAAEAVAHLSWDRSNRQLAEVLKEVGAL